MLIGEQHVRAMAEQAVRSHLEGTHQLTGELTCRLVILDTNHVSQRVRVETLDGRDLGTFSVAVTVSKVASPMLPRPIEEVSLPEEPTERAWIDGTWGDVYISDGVWGADGNEWEVLEIYPAGDNLLKVTIILPDPSAPVGEEKFFDFTPSIDQPVKYFRRGCSTAPGSEGV